MGITRDSNQEEMIRRSKGGHLEGHFIKSKPWAAASLNQHCRPLEVVVVEARSPYLPKLVGAPASVGSLAPEALRPPLVSQGDYTDGHLQRGREGGSGSHRGNSQSRTAHREK